MTFNCYHNKPSRSSASPKPPLTIMPPSTAYISSGGSRTTGPAAVAGPAASIGNTCRGVGASAEAGTGVCTLCGTSQHFVWLCPTCPQFPHFCCRRGPCPPRTFLAIAGLPGFIRLLLGMRQRRSGSCSGCKFEISTGGMCWVYALP